MIYQIASAIKQDWRPMTLKELYIQWQAHLIDSWMHTAHIKMMLSTAKSKKISDYHPYLKKPVEATKVETKPIFSVEYPTE